MGAATPPGAGPRITIITATYNAAVDLAHTARSIQAQSYGNIQWIVIDGGSRDGTADEIRRNQHLISYWVSEPDRGIYDAWNKGCAQIDGDWVLFIGAGDEFPQPDTLARCAVHLAEADGRFDIVYGRIELVTPDGDVIAELGDPWGDVKGKWGGLLPLLPPHPSSFHRRRLFHGPHPFDERFRYAGDTAFVVAHVLQRDPLYIPIVVDRMLTGGVSVQPANILKIAKERRQIAQRMHVGPPMWHSVAWHAALAAQVSFHALVPESIRRALHRVTGRRRPPG